MKVIPKDKQIPAGTRYLVRRNVLVTTKEEIDKKGNETWSGCLLERGDLLQLVGYYYSTYLSGNQYMAFRVTAGKNENEIVAIHSREEYQCLIKVTEDLNKEVKVHCVECGSYEFSLSHYEYLLNPELKNLRFKCKDCR